MFIVLLSKLPPARKGKAVQKEWNNLERSGESTSPKEDGTATGNALP
jgi:hypothetical protein